MRKLLLLTIVGAALLWATPAHAGTEFGPPPGPSHVGCDAIWIDPPPTPQWVQVTIWGTIDGQPVSGTVGYGAIVSHRAGFPDVAKKFQPPGPHHFHLWWTWNLGPGKSPVADGTVTCHEPPTTTTSTTSTTTTTVPKPTPCTEPRGCCLAQCEGPSTTTTTVPRRAELPFTGGLDYLWPLSIGAAAIIGIGNYLLRGWRREGRV